MILLYQYYRFSRIKPSRNFRSESGWIYVRNSECFEKNLRFLRAFDKITEIRIALEGALTVTDAMQTKDYWYDLPEELIAQTPLERRDSSRLMVLDRETGDVSHRHFYDIVEYLRPGD